MKMMKWAVFRMSILSILMVLSVACSSSGSGGGGGGTGEGIYNTAWTVVTYENGAPIDGGIIAIDGSGNLSGEFGEGSVGGTVHGDGSTAAWTTSGSSTASGSFNGNNGTDRKSVV